MMTSTGGSDIGKWFHADSYRGLRCECAKCVIGEITRQDSPKNIILYCTHLEVTLSKSCMKILNDPVTQN